MTPAEQLEQIIKKRIHEKIEQARQTKGFPPLPTEKAVELVAQKLFIIYAIVNEELDQLLNTRITALNKFMEVTPGMYKAAHQLFGEEILIWYTFNEALLHHKASPAQAMKKALRK